MGVIHRAGPHCRVEAESTVRIGHMSGVDDGEEEPEADIVEGRGS